MYESQIKIPKTERRTEHEAGRFITFLFRKVDMTKHGSKHAKLLEFMGVNENVIKKNLHEKELLILRRTLFPDGKGEYIPKGYNVCTIDQLRNVGKYVKEFSVKYRSERNNETIFSSSMKGYIISISRFFKDSWGYDLKLIDEKIIQYLEMWTVYCIVLHNVSRKQ